MLHSTLPSCCSSLWERASILRLASHMQKSLRSEQQVCLCSMEGIDVLMQDLEIAIIFNRRSQSPSGSCNGISREHSECNADLCRPGSQGGNSICYLGTLQPLWPHASLQQGSCSCKSPKGITLQCPLCLLCLPPACQHWQCTLYCIFLGNAELVSVAIISLMYMQAPEQCHHFVTRLAHCGCEFEHQMT